jgi:AraC family transcriptional regulator
VLQQSDPPAQTASASQTDSLGCSAGKLHASHDLCSKGLKFYRRRSLDTELNQVATPASDRGFLVGISLKNAHSRRIFHEHHSTAHDFGVDHVYVRNFSTDYRADLRGTFDFLLMEIAKPAFEAAVEERAGRRVHGLACVTGVHDPVLSSLGTALAPALERPAEASPLFVEQMGTVILTHLLERYGGGLASSDVRTKPLSRLNERRAMEMLLSGVDGSSSIATIADACALSRSHFIKSFRASTGLTPHQWLQTQRVQHARQLLSDTSMTIADIAMQCGFADQSHLTRVFLHQVGATPARWRRALA